MNVQVMKRGTQSTNSYEISNAGSLSELLFPLQIAVRGVRQMPNRPSGKLTLQLTESFSAITSPAAQLSRQNIFCSRLHKRMAQANVMSALI